MITRYASLFFLLLPISTFAQNSFRLTGYVRDTAGRPLAGASVLVLEAGYGATADSLGRYALRVPKGLQTIQFSQTGFQTRQRSLTVEANDTMSVQLEERVTLLREAIVTGQQPGQQVLSTAVGLTTLSIRTLRTLPTLLGELDVLRSVQMLPGVSSVGEASTGFNVRGGAADQNLILLDEVPLFNAQHLLGFLSVFNPDVVQDMDFYRGSAPARYGGRAASVLHVRLREANAARFGLSAGIGLLSSRLMLEAPIVKDKMAFYVAGRLSSVNTMLKVFPIKAVAGVQGGFNDLNARLDFRPNARNKLSLTAFRSSDSFTLPGDSLNQVELSGSATTFAWRTNAATLSWSHYLSARWQVQSSAVWSRYVAEVSVPDSAKAYLLTSGVDYAQFKTNFTYAPNDRWQTDLGLSAIRYGVTAGQLDAVGPFSQVNPVRLPNEQALEGAAYANTDLTLSERWSVQAGLRGSWFGRLGPDVAYRYAPGAAPTLEALTDSTRTGAGELGKKFGNLEPRFSLRWSLRKDVSLKLGASRMVQYLQLLSNTAAALPADRWKLADAHVQPQVADQLSLGYFQLLPKSNVEISVEVFYKKLTHVTDFRGNVPLLLNRYPETAVLQGNGFARGLETLLRRNSGLLTGWLSYTYSQTRFRLDGTSPGERINNGGYYPAGYDRPHVLNAVLNYKLSARVSLSVNGVYTSGRPITYPAAKIYVGTRTVPYYTDRNQGRLPAYIRGDLGLVVNGQRVPGRRFESDFSLSLYNVLGRRNAYSVYVNTRPVYAEYYNPVKAYKLSVLGAIIPSISYNFRFK